MLWRRTDGALSTAASPAVARARSKAREREMQRLIRQVSVREAAYIKRLHKRTAWEPEMVTAGSCINALVDGLRCRLRTIKHGAIIVAVILTAHELQRRHHAHKLSTVDSRSGRNGKEREGSCTGTSTSASRWMDWRTILLPRAILTILTNL